MFKIKYLSYLFIYFLISSPSLNILFSGTNPYLRVRSVANNVTSTPWLIADYLSTFKEVPIINKKSEIYFEFQDINSSNIYTSEKYAFWKSTVVYKDYINLINENILKSK